MIELNRIYNEDCMVGMARYPDKLPDKSGDYICIDHYGRWWQLHYSKRNRAFNSYDHDAKATYALYPDYWAELPEIKEDSKGAQHE